MKFGIYWENKFCAKVEEKVALVYFSWDFNTILRSGITVVVDTKEFLFWGKLKNNSVKNEK